MIARLWSARAARASATPYAAHLRDAVLPRIKQLPGYQGATLLERTDGSEVEFVVITWWRSLDDIRAFAGNDSERAVVAGAARDLLQRFDDHVRHFDVALEDRVSG
jgi:heme-degrading monooxygenase HmoA